jgi:hypothetical protein
MILTLMRQASQSFAAQAAKASPEFRRYAAKESEIIFVGTCA